MASCLVFSISDCKISDVLVEQVDDWDLLYMCFTRLVPGYLTSVVIGDLLYVTSLVIGDLLYIT